MRLRIVSWNINGIRAVAKRGGLAQVCKELQADIACFQETKVTEDKLEPDLLTVPGYESFWSHCQHRKGYAGTATYARTGLTVGAAGDFGDTDHADEGRTTMTDHKAFVLFNVYFPNGGRGPEHVTRKLAFTRSLRKRCDDLLAAGREVIVIGDFNTCLEAQDLWSPSYYATRTGFLPEERAVLKDWLDPEAGGMVEAYRHYHPDAKRVFSWWDNYTRARAQNNGMRLDMAFVSRGLASRCMVDSQVHMEFLGSDHCPISVTLDNIEEITPAPAVLPMSSRMLFPRLKAAKTGLSASQPKIKASLMQNSSKDSRSSAGDVDPLAHRVRPKQTSMLAFVSRKAAAGDGDDADATGGGGGGSETSDVDDQGSQASLVDVSASKIPRGRGKRKADSVLAMLHRAGLVKKQK